MTTAWQATDEDLLLGLRVAQENVNEAFAQMVELIGEARSRGLAEATGYKDLTDLLRSVQNVSRSTARARVRAAEQLAPRRQVSGEAVEPDLAVLAAAVAEGALTPEHVREIQAVCVAAACRRAPRPARGRPDRARPEPGPRRGASAG
ncbi:DUF222 domain-containing protein [Pseudonocardia nematodicida]|uniref:DUF222 domain-containing protein n=1 Tax=Pseudonocardia nematodicida TaxID=1206997 RepID=A0ABV1KGQ1_9PSEU